MMKPLLVSDIIFWVTFRGSYWFCMWFVTISHKSCLWLLLQPFPYCIIIQWCQHRRRVKTVTATGLVWSCLLGSDDV